MVTEFCIFRDEGQRNRPLAEADEPPGRSGRMNPDVRATRRARVALETWMARRLDFPGRRESPIRGDRVPAGSHPAAPAAERQEEGGKRRWRRTSTGSLPDSLPMWSPRCPTPEAARSAPRGRP